MSKNRIAIIVTNTPEYEKIGYRTGLWLGELVHFWDPMRKSGVEMDIASPLGGFVPLDPESLLLSNIGHSLGIKGTVQNYYEDRNFMNLLKNSLKVSDISPENYDAIYLTGGHGVCFDFPKSQALSELLGKFYESNKIVSAVCHGPAGLLEVRLSNGNYLVQGKRLTSFSWQEEKWAKRQDAVPYNLEEELKKRGAEYIKAALPLKSHIVEDGLLITGQNPASAKGIAERILQKLDI
ncbi:type 1 glutamine amidotransferase domain-containing protein [Legionella hackeliae]|uniref:ThiJ/PfpI n=1 Tax=Legionella hackeliae TaxID=449 RepID=A0A0A8UWK5_LEGHA|nr:type 1 glutamine amidotransferase domain-containing protein [Legionella hackeliae]KTD13204.1 intracellular protease/amidase [Legionella hackeliae]CEK11482.1 ThiJ/PfpI [Legionella hackeliae]STX48251.1 intracellular protease/amidase [Legionella hackeliae]